MIDPQPEPAKPAQAGLPPSGQRAVERRFQSQQVEVQKLPAGRVRDTATRFDALVAKELGAFNDVLRSRNIQHIVAR